MMTGDWHKIEKSLFIISLVLTAVMIGYLIYGLTFLSKRLVHAFSTGSQSESAVTQFDFSGFESLNLK